MLGVLLFILKLIGYLLLGILILFTAILLFILFVPIMYHVKFGYEDSFDCLVRVFGIQLYPKKEYAIMKLFRKKKARDAQKRELQESQKTEQTITVENKQTVQPLSEAKTVSQVNVSAKDTETLVQAQTSSTDSNESQADTGQIITDRVTTDQVTTDRVTTDQELKNQTKADRHADFSQKLQHAKASFENVKLQIQDTRNQQAVSHAWRELLYLLKHFGPRKISADVEFSLGDPANTGLAVAALSVCPFVYGKKCSILPDFEAETMYVRGWADIRGHARVVHVVKSGLSLLLDKNVRRLIHNIRKK